MCENWESIGLCRLWRHWEDDRGPGLSGQWARCEGVVSAVGGLCRGLLIAANVIGRVGYR